MFNGTEQHASGDDSGVKPAANRNEQPAAELEFTTRQSGSQSRVASLDQWNIRRTGPGFKEVDASSSEYERHANVIRQLEAATKTVAAENQLVDGSIASVITHDARIFSVEIRNEQSGSDDSSFLYEKVFLLGEFVDNENHSLELSNDLKDRPRWSAIEDNPIFVEVYNQPEVPGENTAANPNSSELTIQYRHTYGAKAGREQLEALRDDAFVQACLQDGDAGSFVLYQSIKRAAEALAIDRENLAEMDHELISVVIDSIEQDDHGLRGVISITLPGQDLIQIAAKLRTKLTPTEEEFLASLDSTEDQFQHSTLKRGIGVFMFDPVEQ